MMLEAIPDNRVRRVGRHSATHHSAKCLARAYLDARAFAPNGLEEEGPAHWTLVGDRNRTSDGRYLADGSSRWAYGTAMKNIYVGNLYVEATEENVRHLFQPFGNVASVTLVKNRDTGRPRGFAFVEMPNDIEAESAIKALNGTVLRQQLLDVNEARPKHEALSGNAPLERRERSREALDTRNHRKHRY
jgi:cold-inducible RNA-binding protein